MNNDTHMPWVVFVAVALFAGFGLGYWYGAMVGREEGRSMLLSEQEVSAEEAKKQAQEEIVQAANPFDVENPLEGGYQNPFKQQVNPFSE